MAEWVETGLARITSGDHYSSSIERASLLPMLIRVQRLAPNDVPFREGEAYALLPGMLVPRFLEPDKIASQGSMNILNIRFGLQSVEEANKTAIGWGLIAEAYANFGYLGVIGVGL